MHALYSILGTLLTPFIGGWLRRRVGRGKEEPSRLRERFGHASLPRPQGRLLWLHAASVGEVQSMLTLVRALLAQESDSHILITTGTVTSAALVAQQNLPRTIHQFTPVDTYFSVKRFLDHWRPDMALWVESEFWPQLLLQAKRRRIPVILVNARLSSKSFQGWKRWKFFAQQILDCFTVIYAGSGDDAARLRALGAHDVIEAGNLKFDAASLPVDAAAIATLSAQIGDRPLWLAASTHANEEHRVGLAHQRIATQFPNLLTIIAPRHAARGDAIETDLRNDGLSVARRSKGEAVTSDTQIYLADTMGELGTFYHLADIVFLGGSLIAHGGHNPLEPARQHCAILSGKHVHNFSDIVKKMQQSQAIRLVDDHEALASTVVELLRNKDLVQDLASNAQHVVESARGASATILVRIAALKGGN